MSLLICSVYQLYERQQRDFVMLELSYESMKQLLTQQQKANTMRDW